MITTWQIVSANRANAKLYTMLDDPRVIAAIRRKCDEHSTPYWEGDPKRSFINLFGAIAARGNFATSPTESPSVKAGQWASHKQSACEHLAAEILTELGINF